MSLIWLVIQTAEAAVSTQLRTVYHPRFRKQDTITVFSDSLSQSTPQSTESESHQLSDPGDPWFPFNGKNDVDFVFQMLKINATSETIDSLVEIHKRSTDPSITFKNSRDVTGALEKASSLLSGVSQFDQTPCLIIALSFEISLRKRRSQ